MSARSRAAYVLRWIANRLDRNPIVVEVMRPPFDEDDGRHDVFVTSHRERCEVDLRVIRSGRVSSI